MKPFILALVGLLSFIFGCGSSSPYHKKDGAWYWKDDRMTVDGSVRLTPKNGVFATAGARAYYRADEIEGSDAATFEALDESYAKDRRTVYFCDTYRKAQEYWLVKRSRSRAIEGADPSTFRLLTQRYARDTARIYFEGEPFPVKDATTFEVLYSSYARDRLTGYYMLKEVKGSDGATFEGLNDYYAKDKSHVWFSEIVSDGGAHPGVVTNVILENADPASFTTLDGRYAKDARQVYHSGRVVKGADPATFTVLTSPENGVDAKDSRASYSEGKKTKG